jgi:excinuclease ABC subunit C
LILPFEVTLADKNLSITVPKIGEKRKLLELSLKNVQYYRAQKKRDEVSKTKRQTPAERILRTLQADLQMQDLPMHIECFDNSNIQGTNPVSSCVVFKNAKPSKQDYRHFKVKTVVGPNDFDTMKEVVHRRYRRLLDENQPLPQLVIIDGGKGQLSAAMESIIGLGLTGKMTVIGVAKRLEEIFFPGDSVPLYINKKSESLKLIQQARNEAHRFAITFHRDQRSKNFIETELNNIPGIGEKTAQKLLIHFGSVRKVREALASELIEVLGMAKAKVVKAYFDKEIE